MGRKRTNDGKQKGSTTTETGAQSGPDPTPSNPPPPGAQVPISSSISSAPSESQHAPRDPGKKPSKNSTLPVRKEPRKKLPKLPANASISKRPLHHAALPSPFASSDQPKVIYLSHSSPFVPALKRIRRLLLEISKRHAQSKASQPRNRQQQRSSNRKPLEPNGRLAPGDVEREIAEEGKKKDGIAGERGEEVYVKATGRAIERALKIGVYFQGESDCSVRVEMGSVMAVDDIEVRPDKGDQGEDDRGNELVAQEQSEDEDLPETRIRMVSSVTVAIRLK